MNSEKKIIAAAVTPFQSNLKIDKERFSLLLRHLFEEGINGALIFGTTGEAASLSLNEKKETLRFLSRLDFNKTEIWVGAGHTSFEETVEFSNYAIELGFTNLLLLPPYYYKNITDRGLYDYFKLIFKKIDCTGANIFFYHFPGITGVPFKVDLVKRLFDEFNCVRGIKDSQALPESLNNFIRIGENFKVFAGNEKNFISHLNNGGAGIISATFNVTADFAVDVLRGYSNGDEQMFGKETGLIEMRKIIEKFPVISAVKYILSLKFKIPEFQIVRPPLTVLTEGEKKKIIEQLSQTEFKIAN